MKAETTAIKNRSRFFRAVRFNPKATTEIYTILFVGSVRCVYETGDGIYCAGYFRRLGELRTRNWLYGCLHQRRLNAPERYIIEAARQLVCARANSNLQFDFGGVCLRLRRGQLSWEDN